MHKYLYSVYDNKTRGYHAPYAYGHEREAQRAFVAAFRRLRGETTLLAEHPADFELRFLGVLDVETGQIDQDNYGTISMTGIEARDMAHKMDLHEENLDRAKEDESA